MFEAGTERDSNGARHIKKCGQHLFQERWEIYRFIIFNSSRFPIEMMCKVLGLMKSGYYSWLKRKPSKRAICGTRVDGTDTSDT